MTKPETQPSDESTETPPSSESAETPPSSESAELRHPVGVETLAGFVALAVPALLLVALGIAGTVTTGTAGGPNRVVLGFPAATRDVAGVTSVVATVALLVSGVTLVGTLGALAVGIRAEWWALRTSLARAAARGTASRERFDPAEAAPVGAALVGGALVTYGLAVEGGASPIVGAGAVGVVAALAMPTRAVPAYCGAFVGVVLTAVSTSRAFPGGSIAGPELATIAVVAGGVAAAVTFTVHARLGASPVLASGTVGLVGGVAAPVVLGAGGGLVAAVVFAASFAGMTEPARIPDERWLAVTGVVVGVLVVFTAPYLSGSGGKLGTIAFASSLAVHGGLRAAHLVRFRQRIDAETRDTT